MTRIDSLIADFKHELNQDGWGDEDWEEDSYNYMYVNVEMAYNEDNSAPRDEIIKLIDDTSMTLQQAYFEVLKFLESKQEETEQ